MGELQHALRAAVQETRSPCVLGERGRTAWVRRLEETGKMEHVNTRLERSSSACSDSAIHRSPQPPQPAPDDPLSLLCSVALNEKSTAPSDSPPPFLRYSLPPDSPPPSLPSDLTTCEPAAAPLLPVEASRVWPAPGQDAGPLRAWSPMSFEGVGAGFGAELLQKGAQQGSQKCSQKGANLTNPNPNPDPNPNPNPPSPSPSPSP